jgi:hypothetical protein
MTRFLGDEDCGKEDQGEVNQGYDRGGVYYLVVVGGIWRGGGHVVEEEVVGGSHALGDQHADLHEALLVSGRDDVKRGEGEGQDDSGGGSKS